MALKPGTSVSTKGRSLMSTDSKEIQYLFAILQALKNEGGLLTEILQALGGSPGGYNTVTAYDISNDAETFNAETIHSISFSVISGSVTVDWGATSVTYPTGFNFNLESSSVFADEITITASTGSDRAIVHVQTS